MRDLMIDIETMGLPPDGAIVSIGALYFDLRSGETGDSLEIASSLISSVELGMTIDPSTVLWWFDKNPEAIAAWNTKVAVPIETALDKLSKWMGQHSHQSDRATRVWANAPSFDLTILKTAFDLAKMSTPWHFRQERCVRTVSDLGKDMGAIQEKQSAKTAHTAINDCHHQVRYCCNAWQTLVTV